MITVTDIVDKRKARWNERHDLEYDKRLVKAAVQKILSTQSLREEIIDRPYLLIEVAFYVVDKQRNTVPFFLNEVQHDFIRQLEQRGTDKPFFVLKGRQQGFTSVITAIQLAHAIVKKNFSGFTMADRSDNTQAIFNDKARTVYERLPEELKPSEKFNSRNEMFFDKLNSSWRIATATDQVGRSRTLNFVHFSEVAFYECNLADLQAGIGEAITAGAIVVYETTANGFNQAKTLWDSGSCHNLFYEWWRSPEYRSTEYEYLETQDSWLIERKKVLEAKGCDKEQITWYCKKYDSYLDKGTIRQEYPITPEEAFISSGESVFGNDVISNALAVASGVKPLRRGVFTYRKVYDVERTPSGEIIDTKARIVDIEFNERADGFIRILGEPRSEEGKLCPYAIGGDTAGSGEDFFAAKVIDSINGSTVAVLHRQHMTDDEFAEQVYCLGKKYHDAIIGVEINYSRQPMRVLSQLGYPNLYQRETLRVYADMPVKEYGFETTARTKPIVISELVSLMRKNPYIERDEATLKEMLTFVKKGNGKLEALNGCHDDLVMATAIAHFVAKQGPCDWIVVKPQRDDTLERLFHAHSDGDNESFMNWEEF